MIPLRDRARRVRCASSLCSGTAMKLNALSTEASALSRRRPGRRRRSHDRVVSSTTAPARVLGSPTSRVRARALLVRSSPIKKPPHRPGVRDGFAACRAIDQRDRGVLCSAGGLDLRSPRMSASPTNERLRLSEVSLCIVPSSGGTHRRAASSCSGRANTDAPRDCSMAESASEGRPC